MPLLFATPGDRRSLAVVSKICFINKGNKEKEQKRESCVH